MRIEQLEYLLEIVRFGSMTKAGESLNITPQSLSRSMKALEDEFDVTLFERKTHGVVLTEQGHQLLNMAENILLEYNLTKQNIKNPCTEGENKDLSGTLKLYIPNIFEQSIVNPVSRAFCKQYPKVTINLSTCDTQTNDNWNNLYQSGELPPNALLLAASHNILNAQKPVCGKEWYISGLDAEYYCACSLSHPLAKQNTVSFDSMSKYPFVVFDLGGKDAPENRMTSYFENPIEIAYASESIHSIVAAIKDNIGIGMILNVVTRQGSDIRHNFDNLKFVQIRERPKIKCSFFSSESPSTLVLKYIDFFAKHI